MNIDKVLTQVVNIRNSVYENVSKDSQTAFLGPTGAGKSTLISCLLDYSQLKFEKKGYNYHCHHDKKA